MEFERLKSLAISDSGFIFDPASGHSYTTNGTGVSIITALKSGANPGDIAPLIMEEYQVSPDDAERDVADFLDGLRKLMLI
jgi:hypothetical protein